jgi:hypothetical protein
MFSDFKAKVTGSTYPNTSNKMFGSSIQNWMVGIPQKGRIIKVFID